MKALIIVDLQNDFLPGGALPVSDGDLIIPGINRLQEDYELVVATQDWHPAGHLSFASQHPGRQPFDEITLDGLTQTLWPDHCVQESFGAEFADGLHTKAIEAIFRKGMVRQLDSYSGFYDNGHRKSTGLAAYLADRHVDDVHVCGLAADFCVYYTAMDSLLAGFNTSILVQHTKAIDPAGFQNKLAIFVEQGGHAK